VVVDHIIAGGCSFSAHGLGGIPPNPNQPTGGCSYIDQGNGTGMEPNTWVGYLAQRFQVQSLANTATGETAKQMLRVAEENKGFQTQMAAVPPSIEILP
jgi:hypothetical protein